MCLAQPPVLLPHFVQPIHSIVFILCLDTSSRKAPQAVLKVGDPTYVQFADFL